MTHFAVVSSIFLIFILASFHIAAAEVTFTTIHYRFDGPPTYCIITPDVSHEVAKEWVILAQNAVLEWESKLQADAKNKEAWNMNYKVIKTGEKIPADCTVELYFVDKPPETNKNLLGSFSTPPATIEIYTHQLMPCFFNDYCFQDGIYRGNDSIYTTTVHEIGHTLGLDHYVSDDVTENYGWTVYDVPPSIMIPKQHSIPSLQKITNEDVSKIRSIYGSQGFYTYSHTTPTFVTLEPEPVLPLQPEPVTPSQPIAKPLPPQTVKPTPPQKTIPVTLIPKPQVPTIKIIKPFEEFDLSNNMIKVEGYDKKFLTISGKISKDEFLKGTPVHLKIDQPGPSDQTLKITTTKNGYFQTILMFDKHSSSGEYSVYASYNKHLDKDMNVSFEVSKIY